MLKAYQCSSPTSRNYTVGLRLGQGEKLPDIINTLGSVAEGVSTAKGVKKIIEEMKIDAPIANEVSNAHPASCCISANQATQVYSVLHEGTRC